MIATDELISEIHELLHSDLAWEVTRLQELARSYASACETAMKRARQCNDLLTQGAKREAYALAQEEPNLEAELAMLDFDDRAAWLAECEQAELPRPAEFDPGLVQQVLAQLDQDSADVGRLLTLYRRMSLGQAPLVDRLDVLRRLMKEDHKEPGWADDVATFEKACLADLSHQAAAADKAGDLAALENILGRLSSNDWSEKPSSHIRAVERLIKPHRVGMARRRYAALLVQLHGAFSTQDQEKCRRLLAEWGQVATATGVQPERETADQAVPVQAWLAEQDRIAEEDEAYQDACARLEQAVEQDGTKLKTLERLTAKVHSFERGMPEHLAAQVASRMEALHRAAKRLFVLRITGIAGAAVIVCLAIFIVKSAQEKSRSITQVREQVSTLLQNQDLEGAGKLLDNIEQNDKTLTKSTEIQALRLEYEKLIQEDVLRQKDLVQTVRNVETAIQDGSLDEAVRLLDRTDSLVRRPDEKQNALDLKEKAQALLDDRKRKRVADIESLITKLELSWERAKASADRADYEDQCNDCVKLGQQIQQSEDITGQQKARTLAIVQATERALRNLHNSQERDQAARDAIQSISRLYDRPNELKNEIQTFAQKYPDHPLAVEFSKSVLLADQWKALDAWRQMVAAWTGRDDGARIELVRTYIQEHPTSLMQVAAQRYLDYLSTRKQAFVDGSPQHADEVREFLSDPLIGTALLVRTRRHNLYVMTKDDIRETTFNGNVVQYRVTYVVDANLKCRTEPVDARDVVGRPPVAAPQVAFAKAALSELKNGTDNWETLYLRLASQAIATEDLDPILCAALAKTMLDYAADTTPFAGGKIEKLSAKLDGLIAPVNWMDYKDEDAARLRPLARNIIQGINLKETIDDIVKQVEQMTTNLARYRPVGVLISAEQVALGEKVADQAVYVVRGAPGIGCEMMKIGDVKNGSIDINKGTDLNGFAGSPVYIRMDE